MDLSKAFDSVNHGILLSKLLYYELKILLMALLKSYPFNVSDMCKLVI